LYHGGDLSMKMVSEATGLKRLKELSGEFRSRVAVFEYRSNSCSECTTPGACCLDAHFVNVRISRLEAVAIKNALSELPDEKRDEVYRKVVKTIEKYGLSHANDATYACPLYDKNQGCLVHEKAKPLPCIHHACYDNKNDLPPDDLLGDAELAVERLNRKVYGRHLALLPLPVAIEKVAG